MLGISPLRHLLREGSYTLDGTHRLFTMPFRGAEGLTVALSFRLPSFADAQALLASPLHPKAHDQQHQHQHKHQHKQ